MTQLTRRHLLGSAGAAGAALAIASVNSMPSHAAAPPSGPVPGLPLEMLVRRITSDTADLYGLRDRGRIAVGFRADLNIIDFDRLRVLPPELVYDLPADGRRLVQRADGYVATIVDGVTVMRDGQDTGARPGRLIRGEQAVSA